jgi:hypothetical protein
MNCPQKVERVGQFTLFEDQGSVSLTLGMGRKNKSVKIFKQIEVSEIILVLSAHSHPSYCPYQAIKPLLFLHNPRSFVSFLSSLLPALAE